MKRPIVLFAIFFTLLCGFISVRNYKSLVWETRQMIPSNEIREPQMVTFKGRVASYDLSTDAVIFSTRHPVTRQSIKLRLRSGSQPDFLSEIVSGRYHFQVTVNSMRNPYRSHKNNHVFDYDRYLYALNIWGQYEVQSYEIELPRRFCLHCLRLNLRNQLRDSINTRYSEQDAGLIKALILAERSEFTSYERYKDLGLAHLFAISGLHFGMIYQLLKKTIYFKNRLLKTTIILCVLSLFLYWIGSSYSAQRALILVVYLELGHLFNRKVDVLNAIAISSILILVVHPYAVLSTSFQLSFYAYFCIAILVKTIDHVKIKNKFTRALWLALIVQLLLLPSNVYFFRTYNGLSFLSNLLMVPMVGILLPVVLFDAIASVTPLATLSIFPTRLILLIFNGIGNALPLFHIPMHIFRNWDFYAVLFFAFGFVLLSVFNRTALKRRLILKGLVLVLFVAVVVIPLIPKVELHFVDVGHGDFSLIKHGRSVVLKDTGDGFLNVSEYLMKQDIYHVNAVVLSHAHRDHYGGLGELLENIKVDHVFLNRETYKRVEEVLKGHQQLFTIVENEMALNFKTFDVHIFPVYSDRDTNENALISSFSNGHFLAYFLGDIGTQHMENLNLIESFDVLKVPHHGSKGSLSQRFYKTYQIKYGILSNGTRYNMPHKEVVSTLEKTGTIPISTYDHGGIVFKFYGSKYLLKTYLHGRF